jgi:leucyl/phenylalanyl-tRNA--protein transferase
MELQSNSLNSPVLLNIAPGQTFPLAHMAWGADTSAPGLLCMGSDLSVSTLLQAYQHGIFPWFSDGEPILWWSPNPRMVLDVDKFRLHHSLKKTLKHFAGDTACTIRMDFAFEQVILACATSQRYGQRGTWIVPEMVHAYIRLHQAGLAHSVETWVNDQLVGGLYCVAIGHAVFGESMFHRSTDASKIALAALVCFCHQHGITHIDCQQNTQHLASLGAREMSRQTFIAELDVFTRQPAPQWHYSREYWTSLSFFS